MVLHLEQRQVGIERRGHRRQRGDDGFGRDRAVRTTSDIRGMKPCACGT